MSADQVRRAAAGRKDAEVAVLSDADHFFAGGTSDLVTLVSDFVHRDIP